MIIGFFFIKSIVIMEIAIVVLFYDRFLASSVFYPDDLNRAVLFYVVWCGVMWCGVVWCDVMWCEVS